MTDELGTLEDAILAFTLDDTDEALRILHELASRNPDSVDVWRALAEVELSTGKLEEAENACRKAIQLDAEDLTSMVSLARILVKKGDKEGAEEASSKARVLGWKEELAQQKDDQ
ncbi:tetratricopeptide repeat protein [Opitutales bacterium]|nr:tetratricopeptide repeat protein [Opitutales bacterium]